MLHGARFDRATLRPMKKDPITGFLRGEAYVSRTGVFPYYRGGKIIRELRHPDDVFHPDSIASAEAAPVTIDHPSTPHGLFADPKDTVDRVVGSIATPVREGDKLRTTLLLTHTDGIDAVEKQRLYQISPGYTADFEEVPGTYQGQAYDGRQRNIRYNHFAVLKEGRQGSDVGLRLDAADGYSVQMDEEDKPMEMTKIRIDSVDFDVPATGADALKAAIAKLTARADALDDELKKAKAAAKQVPEATAAHLTRVVQAAALFGEKADLQALVRADRAELESTMLKALLPDFKTEGRDPEYLRGRLDHALETRSADALDQAKGTESLKGLAALLTPPAGTAPGAQGRTDAKDPVTQARSEADAAYLKMIENRRQAANPAKN